MKKNFIILFLLLVMSNAYAEIEAPKDLFHTANQEYKNGNYRKALENYRKINVSSPELFFNMGQCFYNMNQKGSALFYYTLANILSPRDKYLKDTLSKLKDELSTSGAIMTRTENVPIIDMFSINEIAVCISIFIIIIFTQAIINKNRKKDRFWFYFICWTSLFFLTVSLSVSIRTSPNGYAIVTSSSAEARQMQDLSQKPFYTLQEGSEVKIISRENGWVMVNIKPEEGIKGWIPEKDILII